MYHSKSRQTMQKSQVEWLLVPVLQQSWKRDVPRDAGDSTHFAQALRKLFVGSVCEDKLAH